MDTRQYVRAMIQSLEKKNNLMDRICRKNEAQQTLLGREPYDSDAIEENFREKGKLVEQLTALDDGFDAVFDRVKDTLEAEKEVYATEIGQMQALIRSITDKSVRIRHQEAKNRDLAEKYFRSQDRGIRKARSQYKAVNAYRDAMTAGYQTTAQFLNKKK